MLCDYHFLVANMLLKVAFGIGSNSMVDTGCTLVLSGPVTKSFAL
jgi:hypothetical protein